MFEFSANPKTNIAGSSSQLYSNNTHQMVSYLLWDVSGIRYKSSIFLDAFETSLQKYLVLKTEHFNYVKFKWWCLGGTPFSLV
jgi:hypothetical protein